MQKTVQLSSSFSKNILRRAFFWSFGTHISGAFLILLCTASYNGGLVTISRSIKYIFLLTSLLQGVVALSTLQWKVYVDSKPTNKLLNSFLSSIAIGSILCRLYSERFLTVDAVNGSSDRKFNFDLSVSILCTAVSIFAFLVDVNERGDSNVTLPNLHPKFLDRIRALVLSDFKNWSTTSVFIGISTVVVRQQFFYLYAMISASLPLYGICKLNSDFCEPLAGYSSSFLWSIYCSVVSSFFLRIFLEIAHSLLVVIVTYPLDFSKLDLIEQSSNLASSGEDSFLSEALAIGGCTLGDETFSWRQNRPGNSIGNSSAISSIGKTLVKVEERARRPLSFIELSGGLTRAIPSWQEALNRQKSSSEELLASVKPSLYGPPIVPFLGIKNRELTRFGVLCRSLAFQDLSRISSSKDRVKNLFKSTGKWPEIVFSCCRIMDSATLQVSSCSHIWCKISYNKLIFYILEGVALCYFCSLMSVNSFSNVQVILYTDISNYSVKNLTL
jgi:hypothetical protein